MSERLLVWHISLKPVEIRSRHVFTASAYKLTNSCGRCRFQRAGQGPDARPGRPQSSRRRFAQKEELIAFAKAGTLLSILQSKARRTLKIKPEKRGSSGGSARRG